MTDFSYLPPDLTEDDLLRAICRESFYEFAKVMWHTFVPEKPVWNWHIKLMCDFLQKKILEPIFRWEPYEYDAVWNVPPGTSKSSVFSILLTGWAWTRMPSFRFLGTSYSGLLAKNLGRLTRDLVTSELYRRLFPEIVIKDDLDAKGNFGNTLGGIRYSVGTGGTVTGYHFHCLPWESKVTTSLGEIPIGLIVDNQMKVDILSFDHASGTPRWQKIERYNVRPGKALCRVNFTDGSKLEITPDHQVYAVGRGYVDPVDLRPGDRLYERQHAGLEELRILRQEVLVPAEADQGEQERESVLFGVLRAGVEEDAETAVSGLREDRGPVRPEAQVLLQRVSGPGVVREESFPVEGSEGEALSLVWEEGNGSGYGQEPEPVLHADVCRQTPFDSDAWEGQFQLSTRAESPALLSVLRPQAEADSQAGRARLFSVREDRGRERETDGRSPHRLHEDEQQQDQFGVAVSGLSRAHAPEELQEAGTVREKVVSSVVRAVRVPDQVYNLKVAEDHNYFAEGVLVHNCIVIDDPMDPVKVASEAELANTNHYLTQTLPGRKVDLNIAPTVMVMQRLRQGDPTESMLASSPKCRHISLPAELTPDHRPKPRKLERYYVDGLLDPVRLNRIALDRAKQRLGDFGYASQYLESPLPEGGGMFKTKMLHYGVPPVKFKKLIRVWDKASTKVTPGAKNRGAAYTAGVKMGLGTDGRIWVLDVVRFQQDSWTREAKIRQTAARDGVQCHVGQEQEPGSGGQMSADYSTRLLRGYTVRTFRATGSKEDRADPFSTQVNAGNVWIASPTVTCPTDGWQHDYVEEMKYWPFSTYLDQIDASAHAFNYLAKARVLIGGGGF